LPYVVGQNAALGGSSLTVELVALLKYTVSPLMIRLCQKST
jgi:hypothetical protein